MLDEITCTAVELRDRLRTAELSSTELVSALLERIAADTELGAFITVTGEAALHEAAIADRTAHELAPGERAARLPRLHGLPLAHKDLVDVAGAATTHGSAAVEHRTATDDDPGVATLRQAGALSLGKTQVPEFGLTGYSENFIAAPARNPLDRRLTPGGSSGGSAAAVAAGLLPLAPGSDGGGSIRIPSLATGLVGLKPGLGSIPSDIVNGRTDAFGAPRLSVSGPIAHTAADAALLFDAMRADTAEPTLAAVRAADALTGLSIGMSDETPFASAFSTALSPEAERAFALAASRLEARGHDVEQAQFDYDPEYPRVFTDAWTAGLSLLEFADDMEDRLTPLTRSFRDRARSRSTAEHQRTGAKLRSVGENLAHAWGRYDVVLTPGLTMAPPRVGAFLELPPDDDYRLQCEWAPYTSMVNVSGLPAIAVPMLRTPAGLPMGVQLIGRPGAEAQLLQLAEQLMQP